MPQVRFAWSAQLVDVRRQACPRARWNAQQRAWTMTDADAKTFLAAGHSRLDMVRESSEVAIDGERWIIGFYPGRAMPTRLAQSKPARFRIDGGVSWRMSPLISPRTG